MRARVFHSFLAVIVLLTCIVPARTGQPADFTGFFSDVPPDHPAYEAVNALFLLGVSEGDGQGHFHPESPVTRAELMKLVLLAKGMTIPPGCRGEFADVPCDAWFAPAVELGYRVAIVNGKSERVFAPQDPVTREELLVILVRATGDFLKAQRQGWLTIRERLAPYADADALSPWARPAAAWLSGQGLLPTRELLRPRAPATRAEVAMLIHQVLAPAYRERKVAVVDGLPIRYAEEMEMRATAYATGEPGVGVWTYSSVRVRVGVVAVDPTVIPLGTFLYVEGFGYAIAADIGGAIKGNKIDLYTEDYHEAAYRFGVQRRRVYILDPLPVPGQAS